MLRNGGSEGISEQADHLRTGRNSGHQALNIAILAGGAQIVLVGYDAKDGKSGKKHFFGDHPDNTSAPYAEMKQSLNAIVPFLKVKGVKVFNASDNSAITAFPFVDLKEILEV